MFPTLDGLGVRIELLDATGKRLNEAVDYEPMSIAEAIRYARDAADNEPRAESVVVSVDRGAEGGWIEVWYADRVAGRWPWTGYDEIRLALDRLLDREQADQMLREQAIAILDTHDLSRDFDYVDPPRTPEAIAAAILQSAEYDLAEAEREAKYGF